MDITQAKASEKNTTNDNITEKINRWLDRKKDLFGQKILCIGTGAETARHLAHIFPRASIVCLTEDAVSGAPQAPGDPLLIQGDAKSYQGGLFDTVVALASSPLKGAAAADGAGAAFPVWERGTLYLRRASLLMDHYEEEMQALRRHLRQGGSLLSIVRSEHDEYLLGWCLAAAAEGLAVDASDVRQIQCMEKGRRQVLQGVCAREGSRTDIGALLASNLNYSLDRMNTAAEELQGRDAEIMLQADAASLLRGYHIYQGAELKGKMGVYASAQRPDVLYYFTDVEGDEPYLKRFHTDDRDKLIRHMVGELHRQKAVGKDISWKQLELQDDWSETEMDG